MSYLSYYLADSVVVITGASSGMGKEIAYRYAERGCKIVIGARKIKDLEKVSCDLEHRAYQNVVGYPETGVIETEV